MVVDVIVMALELEAWMAGDGGSSDGSWTISLQIER